MEEENDTDVQQSSKSRIQNIIDSDEEDDIVDTTDGVHHLSAVIRPVMVTMFLATYVLLMTRKTIVGARYC